MSYKDWRVRIDDMLQAIERCVAYTQGMDGDAFDKDPKTQDAVARNLEIIGEAASKMPSQIRERFPLIPWESLAEMRHILIHEYHSVDPSILLGTVVNELPPLVTMLQAVLKDRHVPDATP